MKEHYFQTLRYFVENCEKIWRYILGAIIGGVVYFIVLLGLTELLRVWYFHSMVIGTAIAITVRFPIHKFWAFRNADLGASRQQAVHYTYLQLGLIAANWSGVAFLVEILGMHYLLSIMTIVPGLVVVGFTVSHRIFKIKTL